MEDLFWIGFVGAAIALLFAWLQRSRVMSFSEGNEKMRKIAASIREGANAYLKHQYTTVFKVFLVVFIVLPIACAYPFFQRYFVQGIMIGAVKG